jgi:hypothetical protein
MLERKDDEETFSASAGFPLHASVTSVLWTACGTVAKILHLEGELISYNLCCVAQMQRYCTLKTSLLARSFVVWHRCKDTDCTWKASLLATSFILRFVIEYKGINNPVWLTTANLSSEPVAAKRTICKQWVGTLGKLWLTQNQFLSMARISLTYCTC